ncbi:MAG: arginyltransferase [Capsulimonadales bacterium]|nr:arginyltransferase [Capsulimonadales bacterium]
MPRNRATPLTVIHRFLTGPESCAYLPDRTAQQEYLVISHLTPEEYERRMNAGWRKFGPLLFHPVCPTCQECRPIRISADRFTPNRSQQRALRRNADLRVVFARPTVDPVRLELYHRYHRAQAERKGWPLDDKDEGEYSFSFLLNSIPSVEISIWQEDALVAVALTEVTPNVVSGIYHYHAPEASDRSLGKFAMLQTIELARQLEKPWAYFGYYVADCGSLSYKSTFRPCEILGADGIWRPWSAGEAST